MRLPRRGGQDGVAPSEGGGGKRQQRVAEIVLERVEQWHVARAVRNWPSEKDGFAEIWPSEKDRWTRHAGSILPPALVTTLRSSRGRSCADN